MFPELFINMKLFLFCYMLKIPRIFTKEVSVAEIDKLNSYCLV